MFAEDFSVYFAEFGTDVSIDGVTARGVFDSAYVSVGGGNGMAGTSPALTVATADVPVDHYGKLVVCEEHPHPGGASYAIAEHHPDGTGMSVLLLEFAE